MDSDCLWTCFKFDVSEPHILSQVSQSLKDEHAAAKKGRKGKSRLSGITAFDSDRFVPFLILIKILSN